MLLPVRQISDPLVDMSKEGMVPNTDRIVTLYTRQLVIDASHEQDVLPTRRLEMRSLVCGNGVGETDVIVHSDARVWRART